MLPIGPFLLDTANQRLERAGAEIAISPKALSVLLFLARQPGRLVTKQQLLDAIWPDTFVQEGVLKSYIKEIRKALADDARNPQYIRTEHRRGYRFLVPPNTRIGDRRRSSLPGREAALAYLHRRFAMACGGSRQVVLVTGEPGIGKTTLINAFVSDLRSNDTVRVGRGRCVEQSGGSESYLPLFGALTDLCTSGSAEGVVEVLRRHAPTWLVQMPTLLEPSEWTTLQQELLGSGGPRMVREMMDTIAAMSTGRPLVLVLDDLHWSDPSTIDVLGALARRDEPHQLMVVATYRPVDVILSNHPIRALKQELLGQGLCEELALELLSPADVETYLADHYEGLPAAELGTKLHRLTDGNPLFLVKVTDHLVAQGLIARHGDAWSLSKPVDELHATAPDNLRGMIASQFDRLPPDQQRVIEAGAVTGVEFSADVAAAAADIPLSEAEDACLALCEGQLFLRYSESIGADVPGFAFVHALYREALYERIPSGRKRRLHLAIGECDGGMGHGLSAATRAYHFEAAGNVPRAIDQLLEAARQASRHYATREALQHVQRADDLACRPTAGQHAGPNLSIRTTKAAILRASGDAAGAAAECETMAMMAHDLAQPEAEIVAWLDACISLMWTDRARCLDTVDRAVALSEACPNSLLRRYALGYRAFWRLYLLGWSEDERRLFEEARTAIEQGGTPHQQSLYRYLGAAVSCLHGDYREALNRADQCAALATQIGDPHDFLAAQHFRGWALCHSGQFGAALRVYRAAIAIAEKSAFAGVAGLYRMGCGRIHLEAGDPGVALAICEPIWNRLSTASSTAGAGSLILSAQLLAGALLAMGRVSDAHAVLRTTDSLCGVNELVVEPMFEVPFRLCFASCLLAAGDLAGAQVQTERALALSQLPPEHTYVALSHRMLAEIAFTDGRLAEASSQANEGCAALDGHTRSLGDWRVYATAARCAEETGDRRSARARREQSRSAIQALADSLAGETALLERFRLLPEVLGLASGPNLH